MAKRFFRSGIPHEDLIQAGSLGLIRAAKEFDPRRGCRFSTYATSAIQKAMQRSLSPAASAIKIPPHVYWLRNQLRPMLAELDQRLKRPPTSDEIWCEYRRQYPNQKVSRELVARIIGNKLPACALFSQLPPQETPRWFDKQLTVEQSELATEELVRLKAHLAALGPAVDQLLAVGIISTKARDDFFARYGLNDSFKRLTLEAVRQRHGYTKEMVRQRVCEVWRRLTDYGYDGEVELEQTLEKIETLTGLLM